MHPHGMLPLIGPMMVRPSRLNPCYNNRQYLLRALAMISLPDENFFHISLCLFVVQHPCLLSALFSLSLSIYIYISLSLSLSYLCVLSICACLFFSALERKRSTSQCLGKAKDTGQISQMFSGASKRARGIEQEITLMYLQARQTLSKSDVRSSRIVLKNPSTCIFKNTSSGSTLI